MKGFGRILLAGGGLAWLSLGVAGAHFALVQPPSSLSTENGGKGAPPCGEGVDSGVVTDVQGGHPIAIQLSEFVFHPGHYRFALSVNSRAELPPDPDVVEDQDGNSISASIQNPAKIPVLADGVFAHTAPPSGDWQTSLTLPNLSCDKCTLQIIEFMGEHGANVGGGFYYHHCADLRIKADPALPPASSAWPRTVSQSRGVFPHIASGGAWTTTITLINTSSAAVPVTIAFHDEDGSPLVLASTTTQQGVAQTSLASSVNAIINPNASLLVSTGEPDLSTAVGWADVQSAGSLGGYAIFRSTSGSGPPSEGTSPLQTQFPVALTLPYDNIGGFKMGMALANLSTTAADITATMWDDSGAALGSQTIRLAGNGHTSFVLADRLPATAGKRGIVRFQSSAPAGITALGLRFNPAGGFTSVPTILPQQ